MTKHGRFGLIDCVPDRSWCPIGPLPPCLDAQVHGTLLSEVQGLFRLILPARETLPYRPIITLTTDFGTNDHFVGAMKGVIVDIVPDVQIVDISHAVQAFDVLDGALAISQSYSYFPNGTIHMVVVDPGVGTTRRPILASSDGYHFVAPDNGVLSMVYAKESRVHVRHITSDHYFLMPVSNTFHARDVFAPVAAYLAKQVDSHKFGEEIEDYVRFAAPKPKATGEGRYARGRAQSRPLRQPDHELDAGRRSGAVYRVRYFQDSGGKPGDYGNSQEPTPRGHRAKCSGFSGAWATSRSWPTAQRPRRSPGPARAAKSASFWVKRQRPARERSSSQL